MIPMFISHTNNSRLASTHSPLSSKRSSLQFCPLKQLRFRQFLSLSLLLMVLLLAACGPETAASNNETLVANTKQIALDYQASNDLAQAQTALNGVDVSESRPMVGLCNRKRAGRKQRSSCYDGACTLGQ